MCLLFFALLIGGVFFLVRRGKIGPPPWVNAARSPEHEAKQVLAERFAKGEISTDEFLERASVLNWTPGTDQWPGGDAGKKRR